MKKVVLLLLISLISCKKKERVTSNQILSETKKEKSVAEILSELSTKDTINHLDLSNKKLNTLPDLSIYKIESMNLSFNNLDTIPLSKLPLSLKKLKCTNNNLKKFICTNYKMSPIKVLIPYHNSDLNLEEIDLSFNQLNAVTIKTIADKANSKNIKLRRVILSNNTIEYLGLNDNLEYLDVSNNPNLPSEVNFTIKTIDTLLQKNNTNKLKTKVIPKPGPIICSLETIYSTFPIVKHEEK
ncbi:MULTISPECIES: hypothetical protein [Flavobacterium]|uniref:Leucine-rich repeat domain-containing protein n=1 Tax=Flavobacterium jumunjinense TaxID=998845 RepID=A0ABV5GJC3_9FLAO|nr:MULTISPECIES: hypothetical protein [Flavobacterium]